MNLYSLDFFWTQPTPVNTTWICILPLPPPPCGHLEQLPSPLDLYSHTPPSYGARYCSIEHPYKLHWCANFTSAQEAQRNNFVPLNRASSFSAPTNIYGAYHGCMIGRAQFFTWIRKLMQIVLIDFQKNELKIYICF